jgi:EAL domain-containing protein (putative c-di-GMP-specific phosphodiesterase class I)
VTGGLDADLTALAAAVEAPPETTGHRVLILLAPARPAEILVDHGHRFLDWALSHFHERIESVDLAHAHRVRLGPDRHALVLSGLVDTALGLLAAQRIQRAFSDPLMRAGSTLRLEVLAGITEIDDELDPEELARRCEVALMRAASAPEHAAFFDPRGLAGTGITRLREQIRTGLERTEFQLFYQPKVRGTDMQPVSTEGLVRWHRGGVLLMPGEFIPLVENSALVMPFTQHCVNMAIRQCADWCERGLRLGVSVNVPPGAVVGKQMVDMVEDALNIWSAPPELVTLEITETAIMSEPRRCIDSLRALRALGVRISLDDFGTGYSSLAYFRQLPADELKIDQAFTSGLGEDARARLLVDGITRLAHAFGLTVVAEGVETEEVRQLLLEAEVDSMQGWLFAPALRPGDLEIWARHFRNPQTPKLVPTGRRDGDPRA